MSATCARCGRQESRVAPEGQVSGQHCWRSITDGTGAHSWALPDCLMNQIAAQASLLRSVTTKLEEAAELLEPPNPSPGEARDLVVGVLEILS